MAVYKWTDSDGDECRLLTRTDFEEKYPRAAAAGDVASIEIFPKDDPYADRLITLNDLQLKTLHIVAGYGAEWDTWPTAPAIYNDGVETEQVPEPDGSGPHGF